MANRKGKTGIKKGCIFIMLFSLFLAVSCFLFRNGIISEDIFLATKKDIPKLSENEAEICFLDLWQSESILIRTKEKTVLIDAGEIGYGDDIKAFLKSRNIKNIDLLVLTHPHSDHIGSAEDVIDDFVVKEVLMPDIPEESQPEIKLCDDLLYTVKHEKMVLTLAKPGMKYDFENGAKFEVLGPVSDYGTDYNNWSIVGKFTIGEKSFLFTGDQETEAESDLLNSGADISCNVLKIGHHGSSSSSSSVFLNEASPEYAVILCGKGNDYGHPHENTITALYDRKIKVLRTDLDGDISFVTDGKTISFFTENGVA